MADVEREGSDVVKTIGQLLALAAAFLGLVYAAGGAVLALRLYLARLPSRTIVGQLPRDMVISVGLAWVVLPALAVVAIYTAYRLLRGKTPPPKRLVRQWREHSRRGWAEIIGASAIPAFVVAGSIELQADRALSGSEQTLWLSSVEALSLLGFLVTLLAVLVALKLRARLVDRYGNPERWSTRRPIVWMTLVVALASVPICVILAGSLFPLLDAKVCTTDSEVTGVLIGETSNRTYVGEKGEGRTGPLLVFSVPGSQIKETFIGGDAGSRPCP
jgi:hypothetical protein